MNSIFVDVPILLRGARALQVSSGCFVLPCLGSVTFDRPILFYSSRPVPRCGMVWYEKKALHTVL